MKAECFFCHTRMLEREILKFKIPDSDAGGLVHDFLKIYMKSPVLTSPLLSREIHLLIKNFVNDNDPYKNVKDASNEIAKALEPHWKAYLQTVDNKLFTAMKLAIAGNLIDAGPGHKFNIETDIAPLIEKPLGQDDSALLFEKLNSAKTVLYLGDNCGEIVFDKIFLEQLKHQNVYFVVREAPVLNDATVLDAQNVGIDTVAKIISNGFDAPSTVLEYCSANFLAIFNQADVIISKGQVNFEGLMNMHDNRLFFLLMAKCEVIAKKLGVNKGDLVVLNSANIINL